MQVCGFVLWHAGTCTGQVWHDGPAGQILNADYLDDLTVDVWIQA